MLRNPLAHEEQAAPRVETASAAGTRDEMLENRQVLRKIASDRRVNLCPNVSINRLGSWPTCCAFGVPGGFKRYVQALLSHRRAGHWGLRGMGERAKGIGGQLEVWSEHGTGTEVELAIPASVAYGSHASRRFRLFKKVGPNS